MRAENVLDRPTSSPNTTCMQPHLSPYSLSVHVPGCGMWSCRWASFSGCQSHLTNGARILYRSFKRQAKEQGTLRRGGIMLSYQTLSADTDHLIFHFNPGGFGICNHHQYPQLATRNSSRRLRDQFGTRLTRINDFSRRIVSPPPALQEFRLPLASVLIKVWSLVSTCRTERQECLQKERYPQSARHSAYLHSQGFVYEDRTNPSKTRASVS